MQSKDFAVFILSHGRADTISTYKALRDGLITVGRLAEYRYYNMDSAIESALKVVKEICERQ